MLIIFNIDSIILIPFPASYHPSRTGLELTSMLFQVHLPLDPTSKASKGFAYITFAEPADAVSAYLALDKRSFQGRLLHVLAAVDRHPKVADDEGKKKNVKAERGAQRKAAAGREFNWAMLYMNVGV
jgi:multiple RNA-binding domain-containing protein 1